VVTDRCVYENGQGCHPVVLFQPVPGALSQYATRAQFRNNFRLENQRAERVVSLQPHHLPPSWLKPMKQIRSQTLEGAGKLTEVMNGKEPQEPALA